MKGSEITPMPPQHEQALVPAGYAEKAMASLMQLHTELMDEKERRVDLYRRLMEKEQAIAELRMYVKLLEEKVAAQAPAPAPAPAAAPAPAPEIEPAPVAEARSRPEPPPPPKVRARRESPALHLVERPPQAPAAPLPGSAELAAYAAARAQPAKEPKPEPAPRARSASSDGWKSW